MSRGVAEPVRVHPFDPDGSGGTSLEHLAVTPLSPSVPGEVPSQSCPGSRLAVDVLARGEVAVDRL